MKTNILIILLLASIGLHAAVPSYQRTAFTTNYPPKDARIDDLTIWSSSGPTELITGDGTSPYLVVATSRIVRDVDNDALTFLGSTAKSRGGFFEVFGQDAGNQGGFIATIKHPGFFQVRSAPTNSTTSNIRWDIIGQSGNIRHWSKLTNAALIYTNLWMLADFDAPATAVGSYHVVVQTNGGYPVFYIEADTGITYVENVVFNTPRWIDEKYSGLGFATNPGGDPPVRTEVSAGSGIYGVGFNADDNGDFSLQTQHGVATTNALFENFWFDPHIHISAPSIAGGTNCAFALTLQAGRIWGDFTAASYTITNWITFTNATTHRLLEFGPITNNAFQGAVSMVFRGNLLCLTNDTGSPIIVDSLDVHIPVKEYGTKNEYTD